MPGCGLPCKSSLSSFRGTRRLRPHAAAQAGPTLRALLVAACLWGPCAQGSPVCEACQALASAALRHLLAREADLAAALGREVEGGGPPELHGAAQFSGLEHERLAERCRHLLREDLPALKRLSRPEGWQQLEWRDVLDALCVRRLRCHPDGVWARSAPWDAADASSTATSTEQLPTLAGDAANPDGESGTLAAGVLQSNMGPAGPPGFMTGSAGAAGIAGPVRPAASGVAGRGQLSRTQDFAGPAKALEGEVFQERLGSVARTAAGPGPGHAPTTYERMLEEYSTGAGPWEPKEAGETCGSRGVAAPKAGCSPGAARGPEEHAEYPEPEDPLRPRCIERSDSYKDLAGIRVVVVVFCGRRDRLRILLRYLGRDLRRNGGTVDHVILALWLYKRRDIEFVEQFVAENSHNGTFEIRDFSESTWGPAREGADPQSNRMVRLYQSLDEPDTVYVKIDDDVVYVAPHAIANLVREVLRGRCLLVSANVANHAIMSSLHQERGAHRGFWPPQEQRGRLPWRKRTEINMSPRFQFERHPVAPCVVERWDCAALVHESFLDRAADNTLCAFDFGWHDFNRGGFHEHKYIHVSPSINKRYHAEGARWSTNFFAFKTESLEGVNWQALYGKGDDEEEFTGPHSQRRKEHSCAVGSALTVHFSYGSQEEGLMANTDLLKRYEKLSRKLVPSQGQEAKGSRRKRAAA